MGETEKTILGSQLTSRSTAISPGAPRGPYPLPLCSALTQGSGLAETLVQFPTQSDGKSLGKRVQKTPGADQEKDTQKLAGLDMGMKQMRTIYQLLLCAGTLRGTLPISSSKWGLLSPRWGS